MDRRILTFGWTAGQTRGLAWGGGSGLDDAFVEVAALN
jgi:hypothetical protein